MSWAFYFIYSVKFALGKGYFGRDLVVGGCVGFGLEGEGSCGIGLDWI